MCIRCGECFKACPYNVLQAMGFQQGLEGLWTPEVVADHSGCAPSCNACGQVCPTGAIRALPLEEKSVARMGLAIVNERTCLPYAGTSACQLCVDECTAAGYYALEFTRVHTQADAAGLPIEDTGYLAPVVLTDKCVGCGLCQMSCYRVNVRQKDLLSASAIVIEAGAGKEDRLLTGSYVQLRQQEAVQRQAEQQRRLPHTKSGNDYFVPPQNSANDSPFE
jgi:ferredoxin